MTLAKDLLCNYKIHDLKLLELVSLSTAPMAASNSSAAAIMDWVNQNPVLRGAVRMQGLIELGGQEEAPAGVTANALGLQPAQASKDTHNSDSHGPFIEFRLVTAPQTSILVVRGTRALGRAVLHTRILWSTAWFFSTSSPFGTLFKYWPDEVATLVVSTVHQSLSPAYMPELSGIEVVARMMQDQGRNVVLVGHGYAGTLAQVVGARLGVPAFATSAPGLQYYRQVFGLMGSQDLQHWLVNLVPERDAMPTLDKQVGTTLALTAGCYAGEGRCHDPKELVTYLLDRCYWQEYYRNENRGGLWGGQGPPVAMPDPIGNPMAQQSPDEQKFGNTAGSAAAQVPHSGTGGLPA
ncbi:hypothetical protein BCR44DRAFT_31914 [Catenaria anguillulae PL171]|uniref:Fungal lipase-like domain-containing protein n=1 Tax=Catenaria anguillulae PL171 TaxID=765915 RepID=A0A1Y2HPF6_9FUNG|nr:hypothetical protein BCR44DRAFT_31914 [Catenaria anguillulae PL171]